MEHITVQSTEEAWSKANELFPTDYEYDTNRSAKAGYPIYWTTCSDAIAWISDICVALELNIQHENGEIETIKIDIEEEPKAEKEEAPKEAPRKKTSAAIRRWENEEWSYHHPTSQEDLQRMARKIFSQAEHIEDQETPGHSTQELSRVYTVTSSLLPDLEYIIHIDGFKVQDIVEIRRF